MSESSAKLPLPEKGFKIISSQSSTGIPKNENIGDKILFKNMLIPLALKSSIIMKIATMLAKISKIKVKLFCAPCTKTP